MANQIIVSEDRNQITVVEGETRIVEVVTQGPQGPIGPVGPQGPSGSSILNQITSGSVTASVDIGSNVFRISTGAQPYLGLTYENSGVMRHQNSTPPYFTIFNNNGGVNMTPGPIGFIEIGGQRGGGGGTMVRFSGTYIGDGNSRNARLSIGTAQGTGFGGNQISIFKLSSGSFTNQPITIIGTGVDSYSTSSIDITGSYASRATTIINGGTGNSIASFDYNGVPQTVLFPNGNWGINTFADGGQKLQVSGSTRLSGDTTITGSLTVTGAITAQTLVVQTITSSVSFITGSTKFGSLSTNTHQFTGSVLVSGSMGIGTNSPLAALDINEGSLLIRRAGNDTTPSRLIFQGGNGGNGQIYVDQNMTIFTSTSGISVSSIFGISNIDFGSNKGSAALPLIRGTNNVQAGIFFAEYGGGNPGGVAFSTSNLERARFTPTGNLLLGLTTDDTVNRLQVSGSTRLIGGLVVTGSIFLSGSMGIGTSTPATLFDIYSAANANSSLQVGESQNIRVSINTQSANRFSILTISRIGDGATPAVSIGVGTGPTSTSGVISTNNDSLIFGYNIGNAFTETFRINTSNRLLLGLTTDDTVNRLQVSGSTRLIGGLVVTGSTTITSGLSVGSDTTINGIARINTASTYALRLLNSTIIAGHDGSGGSELSLNLSTAYLSGYGALQLRTLQSGNLTLATSNTNRVWVSGVSGNVSIGSSNDSGDRLQVYGATFLSGSVTGSDMLIRGSGNTSALEVQNNSGGLIAQFRNDTRLTLGGKVDIGLTNILFNNYSNTLNILGIVPAASWASDGTGIWFFDRTASSTSGTLRQIRLGGIGSGFTPTSGTATHTHLEINSTISQSSATGITRGLYVNPTLTSAADWRSIEWSNNSGWGLYGSGSAPNYLNGSLSIGETGSISAQKLQVYGDTLLRGSGTTSGTFALRIKNSADSDLFFIRNNGLVYTGDVEFISSNGVLKSVGNLSLAVGTAGGLSITKPANLTATSGDFYWLWINPSNATSFVPASGNATMTFLSINPAISQSSATGITRGLYVVPSLTSAADWRSIEWTNNTGWGLYGAGSAPNFLSGSLGIGTAPSESLSVSQLRAVVSIKDNTTSTNSTTFFGAYDDFLQLSANRNPSTGIFSNTGKATSQISLQGSTNSGSIYFYTTNTNNTIPIERARITGIGNLLLGTTTDDGVNKLQVSGSTLLKGSGNTSGTNALVVQNSDAVSIMSFRNDGNIYADGTNFTITKYTPGATTLTVSNTGHNDAVGIRTTSAVGLQAVSSLGVSANNTRGASIYAAGGAQTGNISLGLLSNRALITSVASGMAMHTSSMLQVDSTSQGFLPPRMTTAQKNAITTPAAGLVVYDTTLNKLCVYTTTWETITSA